MNPRYRQRLSSVLLSFALATLSTACQTSTPGGVTDTNTNWLESCDSDASCGGLRCHCGLCSDTCTNDDECAAFGQTAVCAYKAADACERRLCLDRGASDTVSSPTDETSSTATSSAGDEDASSTSTLSTESERRSDVESSESGTTSGLLSDASLSWDTNDASSLDSSVTADASSETSDETSNAETTSADTEVDSGAQPVDCEAAVELGACSGEGDRCGGPCTDACNFCNLLVCTSGAWQRMEVFPAPCFDCGESQRCNPYDSYCSFDGEATYACEALPQACAAEPSCECLSTQLSATECTANGNEFTLEVSTAALDGG